MSVTLRDMLGWARAQLAASGEAAEADILVAHALGRDRAWLVAHDDAVLPPALAGQVRCCVSRRLAGEPVAYIIGTRGFHALELAVTPDVLIPRPETELLVELALERIAAGEAADIADLGTGSGAIALSLALARPRTRVLASDASAAALEVARGNALRLGIGNVDFSQGDWCAALGTRHFDMIVANPPYIAADDAHLAQGDLRFEPRMALASGVNGMDAIHAIARGAPAHLRAAGWLLLEHGFGQGEAVRRLLRGCGLRQVITARDLEDRERVTMGRAPLP